MVDIDAVDKDVVYVVKMYGDDDDLKVGSKKGIRELISGMLVELAGDLLGFVGVIKDIDELNELTDVDSSGSTGEEVIIMDGGLNLHLLLDSICLVLISFYLL